MSEFDLATHERWRAGLLWLADESPTTGFTRSDAAAHLRCESNTAAHAIALALEDGAIVKVGSMRDARYARPEQAAAIRLQQERERLDRARRGEKPRRRAARVTSVFDLGTVE